MADTPKTRQETRLTHAGRRAEWTGLGPGKGGIVNPPVWRASTHLYETDAERQAAGRARGGRVRQGAEEIGRAHV